MAAAFRLFKEVAVVPMPETAVNEYYGVIFTKDEIGFARQVFVMQAKAESLSVKPFSD